MTQQTSHNRAQSTQIGPFVLDSWLGQGATCDVWRGHHQTSLYPVAVKVAKAEMESYSRTVQSFHNEVRAIARMYHPSIIRILDYGETVVASGEFHPRSRSVGQTLQADSSLEWGTIESVEKTHPYLVMELADDSLETYAGQMSWSELYPMMSALLQALAHAHARGVIHRDLKPANILRKAGDIRLTDFGIAHAVDVESKSLLQEQVTGTPAYMAPEQFMGEWRKYGPWTDMYALGCTVYALCCGKPPFGNEPLMEVMAQHIFGQLPPLRTKMQYPPDFFAWLQRLTAKSPSARFQRAADALWALQQIHRSWQPDESERVTLHSPSLFQTIVDADAFAGSWEAKFPAQGDWSGEPRQEHTVYEAETEGRLRVGLEELQALNMWGVAADVSESCIPPCPPTWREQHLYPTTWLPGTGLGLFAWKHVPLLGREQERDLLWQHLQTLSIAFANKTTATSVPVSTSVIQLRGATGYGKSYLAQWFCERAHEAGAADYFKVLHASQPGAHHGLAAALSRYFGCVGLSYEDTYLHFRQLHEQKRDILEDIATLASLLCPNSDKNHPKRQEVPPLTYFQQAKERYQVITQCLHAICKQRPMIVWLDDIHWGLDSLHWVLYLLQQKEAPFVLLVMTVQDEALLDYPVHAAMLDDLAQHQSVWTQHVGPLPEDTHVSLVKALLPMERDLVQKVAQRTAGNPMFAVELVRQWVQQRALVSWDDGFRLDGTVSTDIPESLYQIWKERLERVFGVYPLDEQYSIELAAVLGQHIDVKEWSLVCELAQIRPASALFQAMLEAHWIDMEQGDGGVVSWHFVHSMLREALEYRVKQKGLWEEQHRYCAVMLEPWGGARMAERRGKHWMEARAWKKALDAMTDAIQEHFAHGNMHLVAQVLGQWERCLEQAEIPSQDPAWGHRAWWYARMYRMQAKYEESQRWIEQALVGAELYSWPDVRVQALHERSSIAWVQGRGDDAWQDMVDAERIAQSLHNPRMLGEMHTSMGDLLSRQGRLQEAEFWLQSALQDYLALQDHSGMGMALFSLASVARQLGKLDDAAASIEAANIHLVQMGARHRIANCLNLRGDIERLRGRVQEAERHYRNCLILLHNLESSYAPFCEANIGLCLLALQRFSEAQPILEHCLHSFQQQNRAVMTAAAKFLMLPCLVYQLDWSTWDTYFAEGRRGLLDAHFFDVDFATVAQQAGEMALAAGEPERAKAVLLFAREQWVHLQRSEELERLEQGMQSWFPTQST